MSKSRKLVIWTGKAGKIELEVSFKKEVLKSLNKEMSAEEELQMRKELQNAIPSGAYKIEI